MPEYTVREVAQDEAELLSRIIRQSFRDVAERFDLTPENCPKHPSNCTAVWIEAAFEKGVRHYVLEADGAACGCVALERAGPDVCYLERLAVLPQFRHRGFGAALVNHACTEAGRLGAERVEIGTIAEHTELNRWYEKLGFCPKNTATFEHLPFEVAFMSKELDRKSARVRCAGIRDRGETVDPAGKQSRTVVLCDGKERKT